MENQTQAMTNYTLNNSDTDLPGLNINGQQQEVKTFGTENQEEPKEWYSVETSGEGYSTKGSDYKYQEPEAKTQGEMQQEIEEAKRQIDKITSDIAKYDTPIEWYEIKKLGERWDFVKKWTTEEERKAITGQKIDGWTKNDLPELTKKAVENANKKLSNYNDIVYKTTRDPNFDNTADKEVNKYKNEAELLREAGINPAILGTGGGGGGLGSGKATEEEEKRRRRKEAEERRKEAEKERNQRLMMQIISQMIGVGGLATYSGLNRERIESREAINQLRETNKINKHNDEQAYKMLIGMSQTKQMGANADLKAEQEEYYRLKNAMLRKNIR